MKVFRVPSKISRVPSLARMPPICHPCINPCYRTVRYWYDVWRSLNLGPRTGVGIIEVNIQL